MKFYEIDKFNSCLDVYVLELAPPFICSSCHNTQAQLASEGRLCRPLPRQISLDLVSYSHRAREEDKDLAGGDGAVQLVGEGNRDAPHRLHSRQSSPTLALPRRRRRGQPRWWRWGDTAHRWREQRGAAPPTYDQCREHTGAARPAGPRWSRASLALAWPHWRRRGVYLSKNSSSRPVCPIWDRWALAHPQTSMDTSWAEISQPDKIIFGPNPAWYILAIL
jgi:hypothetical protein